MGFRKRGSNEMPESARDDFLEALRSGLSQSAASTVARISRTTGKRWAKAAGHQANPKHHGLRYSAAVREEFWAAMHAGATVTEACVSVGVSEHRCQIWLQQAGFVPRTQARPVDIGDPPQRVRAPLTFSERCRLEELLGHAYQPVQVANLVGRHKDTITREIARGQTSSGYRAGIGQDAADARRRRPKERKLDTNPALLAVVLQGLESRYSPEQIAGRLSEDFPEDPEMRVSHETIYQAIYVQPRGELAKDVKSALRTGRIKRKPHGRKEIADRSRFKASMVNISERPAEAEDRAIPGHWESQWCCQAA